MKTQEIGQSGMIASRVALGVMRMDALDAADAARTVAVAHDSGIDYFDTADIYGFHDHAAHASSKRFGQAWKDAGLDRSTIFIQTKFGIDYSFGENDGGANGYDFSAKHLIDALDHELEALQTDYVDAVLLHRIDTLFELNEVAEAFDALESSGKVRHFGVSNMGPWQIELLQSGLRQKLEINQLQFGLMHTQMLDAEIQFNMASDPAADRTLFTAEAYDHSGMVPIPIRHGIRSVRRQRAFPRAERRIDPSCRQIRFHAQRHCRRLDSASSRRYPAVARLNDTGAHPPDGGRCRYRTRTP
jgi:predicted oxidoreductase